MTTNDNKKVPKSSEKFICEKCDYYTVRKSQYDRHLLTAKHAKTTNNNGKVPKGSNTYSCDNCNKCFNDRAGLWRHKKKCLSDVNNFQHTDKELICMLLKQNAQLIEQNAELVKNGTQQITNNTNCHNKTFNLQFFLHETCKDAMNIMDFVNSIKLQLSDLEKVGSIGYVEGISNIITTNLQALDITQRPIHCTDNKREVLYVKDEDKWEKENDEKKKIRKAIKHIAHKNSKLITDFKNKYPDCVKSDSKKSDQYNKLIFEAMGGPGDNDMEKEDKIIKKITKEVTIDKNILSN